MLRVNTRVETQGDRTGGEERLNMASLGDATVLCAIVRMSMSTRPENVREAAAANVLWHALGNLEPVTPSLKEDLNKSCLQTLLP